MHKILTISDTKKGETMFWTNTDLTIDERSGGQILDHCTCTCCLNVLMEEGVVIEYSYQDSFAHKFFPIHISKFSHLSHLFLFNVRLLSHLQLCWSVWPRCLLQLTEAIHPTPPPTNAAKYHVTIKINSPLTDLHLLWLRCSDDVILQCSDICQG